ncbi:hypothetical protein DSO57_1013345 [Entomophthora muscae]|uniref:Uncharacterized protein n=1 Tax=Entomophthora muscae TaxID=34485 RepID=A0ACC2URQ1_9FUNG|nr:hypothetical protein DSO57_1013345 [Entomophthora muscae]
MSTVMNDISTKISGKLQLGESNSGPNLRVVGILWALGLPACVFHEQDELLEALNQYGIIPVTVDRLSKKGFAAQHNKPESKGNPDNWLETQAAGPCDPQSCSDPKATPKDVQLMEQRLSWLKVSEGHLVQNERNTSGSDEAMKTLSLDHQMEFIPAEDMTGQKDKNVAGTLGLEETEQTQLSGDRLDSKLSILNGI